MASRALLPAVVRNRRARVSVVAPSVGDMIIDCGSCAVRGDACADCVVTFLTIPVRPADVPVPAGQADTPGQVELDDAERGAIGVLARSGLVPPLRLRRVV